MGLGNARFRTQEIFPNTPFKYGYFSRGWRRRRLCRGWPHKLPFRVILQQEEPTPSTLNRASQTAGLKPSRDRIRKCLASFQSTSLRKCARKLQPNILGASSLLALLWHMHRRILQDLRGFHYRPCTSVQVLESGGGAFSDRCQFRYRGCCCMHALRRLQCRHDVALPPLRDAGEEWPLSVQFALARAGV